MSWELDIVGVVVIVCTIVGAAALVVIARKFVAIAHAAIQVRHAITDVQDDAKGHTLDLLNVLGEIEKHLESIDNRTAEAVER